MPHQLVRALPWLLVVVAFFGLVGYLHRAAWLQELERSLLALPDGLEWWQEAGQWADQGEMKEERRAIAHGRVVRVVRSYPDGRPPQLQAVELDRVQLLRGDRFWRREATLYIDLRDGQPATPESPVAGDWWTVAVTSGERGNARLWMALPTPRAVPAGGE